MSGLLTALVASLIMFSMGFTTGHWVFPPRPRAHGARPLRDWENVCGDVWFPLEGAWELGHVHNPTDPTRHYYKVYAPNRVETFRVAAVDLRAFADVHNEPAPALSVVELEEEMKE